MYLEQSTTNLTTTMKITQEQNEKTNQKTHELSKINHKLSKDKKGILNKKAR